MPRKDKGKMSENRKNIIIRAYEYRDTLLNALEGIYGNKEDAANSDIAWTMAANFMLLDLRALTSYDWERLLGDYYSDALVARLKRKSEEKRRERGL